MYRAPWSNSGKILHFSPRPHSSHPSVLRYYTLLHIAPDANALVILLQILSCLRHFLFAFFFSSSVISGSASPVFVVLSSWCLVSGLDDSTGAGVAGVVSVEVGPLARISTALGDSEDASFVWCGLRKSNIVIGSVESVREE